MIFTVKHFLIYAGILILSGCEFQPSDIPLNSVSQPATAAPLELKLTPEMDTVRIAQPLWITYTVNSGEHKIYSIKVQLDEAILNVVQGNDIRTWLDLENAFDGWHDLQITIYYATNSGSIADKLNAEAFVYNIHWPVYINMHARDHLGFNPVSTANGNIKLSWPEYHYADFGSYIISWSSPLGYGSKTIYDPHQNSFTDSTLVEGCNSYYTLRYYFSSGYSDYNLNYCMNLQLPAVKVNADNTINVSWSKSVKEKSLQSYCLTTTAPYYGRTEEHDITDLSITSIRLTNKIGFGGDYTARLKYIPKLFKNYHSALETKGGITSFALGDSVPLFNKSFYISSDNSFLLYSAGRFFKYYPQTGKNSDVMNAEAGASTILNMISCSPDGIYFGYFWNEKYVVRRTSDFSVVNTVDIQGYQQHNLILNDVHISNNGIISTADYNGYIRLFNVATGVRIYENRYSNDGYNSDSNISPDGQNLAIIQVNNITFKMQWVYYNFDGVQLNELGRVDVGSSYAKETVPVVYYPESQHKMIIPRWISLYHYVLEVRDTRDFTLLHSSDVTFEFVPVVYDFASDMAIAQFQYFPPEKYSILINLNTGTSYKIIQLAGSSIYFFFNGKLYSGNGRSINVDDYKII